MYCACKDLVVPKRLARSPWFGITRDVRKKLRLSGTGYETAGVMQTSISLAMSSSQTCLTFFTMKTKQVPVHAKQSWASSWYSVHRISAQYCRGSCFYINFFLWSKHHQIAIRFVLSDHFSFWSLELRSRTSSPISLYMPHRNWNLFQRSGLKG